MEDIKCSYGCDNLAIRYFHSTKKWCCSKNVNSCPAKRKRDSLSKKGKNPFKDKKHPRGMLGKRAWNRGIPMSNETKEKLSNINSNNPKITGRGATLEKEALRASRISATSKLNKRSGGYRPGSGVGVKSWYDSPIAGAVHLQSSYELRLAKILDFMKLNWRRNLTKFPFDWNGEIKHYIPDFFVLYENQTIFIEVKGYVTEKDIEKWRSFKGKLHILKLKDIEQLEMIQRSMMSSNPTLSSNSVLSAPVR